MPYYGARVRAARGFAGLTQEDLADALGVDAATIKRREAKQGSENYKEPKKGERLAIANVCGVPVDFLEQGFRGEARSEISQRLQALEEILRDVQRELALAGLEALLQTDEADDQEADSPSGPQQ